MILLAPEVLNSHPVERLIQVDSFERAVLELQSAQDRHEYPQAWVSASGAEEDCLRSTLCRRIPMQRS